MTPDFCIEALTDAIAKYGTPLENPPALNERASGNPQGREAS
ncbi:MAG: hypothetical protein Q8Q81_16475 [Oxalobacteraceae bacterium]|nr:hypothetical protein [Oxalobacteraceae bacterium]